MTQPIVTPRSKVSLPRVRAELMERSRLLDRLEAGRQHKLALVCAPAGYGKTTTVVSWLARSQPAVAWVSLDEYDNDLPRFFGQLVAGLQRHTPAVGERTLSSLQGSNMPAPRALALGLLREIEDFCNAAGVERIVLVLDDYHHISDYQIHDAVALLLDYLPPELQLVLISRVDPPLPISELRVRDELTEVRAADLRFTTGETEQFMREVMGLELVPADAVALQQRTEGWIASLQLSAIALRAISAADAPAGDGHHSQRAFIAGFAGSDSYTVDYLIDEVLSRQAEDIKAFLIQSSVLDRLCAALCDAVLQRSDSARMLRELDRLNLFLVPLDHHRGWYRYHQLFAELLRAQFFEQFAELHGPLCLRASRWFEQHEMIPDAVACALQGNEVERAATLLETYADDEYCRSKMVSARWWRRSFPPELLNARPRLMLLKAWCLTYRGQTKEAGESLDLLQSQAGSLPPQLAGEVASASALLADYTGNVAASVAYGLQADRLLAEDDPVARPRNAVRLGVALLDSGDIAGAERYLIVGIQQAQQTNQHSLLLEGLGFLLQTYFVAGRLVDALAVRQQVEVVLADLVGATPTSAGYALWGAGLTALARNELDDAAAQLWSCAALLDSSRAHTDDLIYVKLQLARVEQLRGRAQSAQQLMADVDDLCLAGPERPWALPVIRALQADFRLVRGEAEAALAWAEGAARDEVGPVPWAHDIVDLEQARVYLRCGRPSEALHGAARLAERASAGGRRLAEIESLTVQAGALTVLNRRTEAAGVLARAVALAAPEGILRPFVEERARLAPVLAMLEAQPATRAYVQRIVQELQRAAATREQNALVEPLTERETEILRLLAAGRSSPEIAESLFIGVTTVRSHVKNLYRKLDVHSRHEAIALTRELRLL